MTRTWPIAGAGFALVWVFVGGVTLSPAGILGQFLLGLAVGMPVAYVFRRLYDEEIRLRRSLRVGPAIVLYAASFTREVLVANVDVAYRVLAPRRAIEPQVILVPLRVETALGVTTIANSITLTPGTITLDYEPDGNALYVHIIDGRNPHSVVEPIRTWEDQALVIFDEPLSPDDEVPGITIHPPARERPTDPRALSVEPQRPADDDTGGDADGQ